MEGEIKVKMDTKIIASLAISLLMLIFVFALPMPVSATEVVISNASAYPNDNTSTLIVIYDAENVGVVDLNLSYVPSVVRVINITNGSFDVTIPNLEKKTMGFVRIGVFQTVNHGLNGTVTIANIKLKAMGSAGQYSPLTISINTFTDATPRCNDINYIITNGTFTIVKPTPSPPSEEGGGGGGGAFIPLPSPTLTPYLTATPVPAETSKLAPTVTPPTATPAQTPAPTIPAAQVPVISWSIIMIAIFISVIIVLTGYLLIRKMS